MFVLVVGAGRVGSSVATSALRAGHTVSVLDEDPLSHERLDVELGQSWEEAGGRFTIGTALELDALVEAMKTCASSIPASTSASSSSAVPIVKRPPASSHDWPSSTSSRSCESGSSSSTDTV